MSCCVWGRGHGWAVLATTELLAAAAELGLDTEVVAAVTSLYRRHARLLLGAQSEDTGLWHNILTDTETFTETSASAMFLTGTLLYRIMSVAHRVDINCLVSGIWCVLDSSFHLLQSPIQ